MTREEFGFSDWFRSQLDPAADDGLDAVRVVAVHKGECEVSDGERTWTAKMSGRLRHRAASRLDYPTVGDWVLAKEAADAEIGTVHRVLGRRNALRRKTAGRTVRHQLVAANIDTAFIMQAAGPGYSLPRIERYLAMVNESGIEPVVLLSKSDLLAPADLVRTVAEARGRMPGTALHAFSIPDRRGLDGIAALFKPGRTCCIVGPSGVGKTTLLNHLLGEERLFTLPVREKDGKGLHSTTWRELVALANGALVVDTPGMRELGALGNVEGIHETFDDIRALAGRCRFGDCSHQGTPGCAVAAAVASGEIAGARYANFIRLAGEAGRNEQAAIEHRWRRKAHGRFHRSGQGGAEG